MANLQRQEKLTSAERFATLLRGEKPDRVAFVPFIFGFCGLNCGYTISDIYFEPVKSFWAQLWSAEMYHYDGTPLFSYAALGPWEYGGSIKKPSGPWEMAPIVTDVPVKTIEDVDKLEKPDWTKAGSYPLSLEFSKLQKQFGMPVTVEYGMVFTIAANLCDVSVLSRWIRKYPEVVHKLLRKVTAHQIDLVKFWGDTFGFENLMPMSGDPVTSNQIISPKVFEEFVLPYQKELNEKILDMGVKNVMYHICGEQNLNLPYWAQIPFGRDGFPGLLSFGVEVDISDALKWLGDKNIICGNVDPTVIQHGTPQEVYDLCVNCIEKGRKAPIGFVLMSGCEVPPNAPPYNVYMMTKAVMEQGWYD